MAGEISSERFVKVRFLGRTEWWTRPIRFDASLYNTVDARWRHLIMMPDSADPEKWMFCAEQAPDVFAAVNTSSSGDLGLGPDKQTAQAAVSIAETAATAVRPDTKQPPKYLP